jgi:hypothetical protein
MLVGCGVAVGRVCPKGKEHDKMENAKAIVNRNTLLFKEVLISLLLTLCGQDSSEFLTLRSQQRLHLHSLVRRRQPVYP